MSAVETINMDDLTGVVATPAVIEFDFVGIKARLQSELTAYDIEVTLENMADAKAKATELNKLAGALDEKRKEKVAEVSAPIKAFEAQVKELIGMAQGGRQKILAQVKTFEDKVRAVALQKLEELRDRLYEELGVRPEYRQADVSELAIISNLTDKLNLTKKAIDTATFWVQSCRAAQDKFDLRGSRVEAESLKAGLKVPLRPQDLAFLNVENDEQFDRMLADRIASELRRQAAIEAAAVEAEQRRQAAAEKANTPTPQPAPAKVEPQQQTKGGRRRTVVVTATFTVSLDAGAAASADQVAAAIERKIIAAGFTTLTKINGYELEATT